MAESEVFLHLKYLPRLHFGVSLRIEPLNFLGIFIGTYLNVLMCQKATEKARGPEKKKVQ